jgi:hypothetical protein
MITLMFDLRFQGMQIVIKSINILDGFGVGGSI